MNKIVSLWNNDNTKVYVFAVISSILLSLLIANHEALINPDGICYLLSAQQFETKTLKDVMHYCPQAQWPFYSTIIYAFGQISHLPYFASAIILNALFSLISVLSFILIIKEMGGSSRVLWFAAFVVLFNHQFNVLRINIIRDHGFWGFYLSSIYFMLRYFRNPSLGASLALNASLFLATLFRIEGVIFLFLMPFLSWLNFSVSLKQRAKSFLILILPILLMVILVSIWQLTHLEDSIQKLGRIKEVVEQIDNGLALIIQRYQISKAALIQYVLPTYSIPDAGVLIFLMFITWYFYNVLITLSFVGGALLLYAWLFSKTIKLPSKASLVLWGYLFINFIITIAFLAENLFVSKRYLIALTLVLTLWIPFALDDLLKKWPSWRHKIFLLLTTIIIFAMGVSSIHHFGRSKLYIRSAGNWLAYNVPKDASLYVNDLQLMYYTQHFGSDIYKVFPQYRQINPIMNGEWKKYDYLAIRLNHKGQKDLKKVLGELKELKAIHIFSNRAGDRVIIYRK